MSSQSNHDGNDQENDLLKGLDKLPTPPSRSHKSPTELSLQHKYDQIRGMDSSHITGIRPKSPTTSINTGSSITSLDTIKSQNTTPFNSTMTEDWHDIVDGFQALSGFNSTCDSHNTSKATSTHPNKNTDANSTTLPQNSGFYAMNSADDLLNEFQSLIQDEKELHRDPQPQSKSQHQNQHRHEQSQHQAQFSPVQPNNSPETHEHVPQSLLESHKQPQLQPKTTQTASPTDDINIDDLTDELTQLTGYTPQQFNELEQAVHSNDLKKLSKIQPIKTSRIFQKKPTSTIPSTPQHSKLSNNFELRQKNTKDKIIDTHCIDFLADSTEDEYNSDLDSDVSDVDNDDIVVDDVINNNNVISTQSHATPSNLRSDLQHAANHQLPDFNCNDDVSKIINQVLEENKLEDELNNVEKKFNCEQEEKLNQRNAQLAQHPPENHIGQPQEHQHPPSQSRSSTSTGVQYYQQIQANQNSFIVPTTTTVDIDDEFGHFFQ